jgi:hypothetical protein
MKKPAVDEWLLKQQLLQAPADMIREAHTKLMQAEQQLKGLAEGGVELDADDRLLFVSMQLALVEQMKSLRTTLHTMKEQ